MLKSGKYHVGKDGLLYQGPPSAGDRYLKMKRRAK